MKELHKLLIIMSFVALIFFSLGYLVEKREVHNAYIQGLSNGIPFAWGLINARTHGDVSPADESIWNLTMYKLGQRYYVANNTERDEIFKILSLGG